MTRNRVSYTVDNVLGSPDAGGTIVDVIAAGGAVVDGAVVLGAMLVERVTPTLLN